MLFEFWSLSLKGPCSICFALLKCCLMREHYAMKKLGVKDNMEKGQAIPVFPAESIPSNLHERAQVRSAEQPNQHKKSWWIINCGLPWWRSGWESACQCRGHGFEPWSGKIPHAAEQLGPWATITEPVRLEPVLHNKRGCDSERPAHCDEEWPPLATTRESPRTETKTQHSQNKK